MVNHPVRSRSGFVSIIALLFTCVWCSAQETEFGRAALVDVSKVTAESLERWQPEGFTSIVLMLEDSAETKVAGVQAAVRRIRSKGLDVYYWIEVARCPRLADLHPAWMASLQTHDEWRRYFPEARQPKAHEVAKTYPWVPILAREPYKAQLQRVQSWLKKLPKVDGVYLNDLQGAPSACGCGSPLCRWTSDYGKRRTTVPLGDDAAALFVTSVKKSFPGMEVIPVWTTECEQHDGDPDGLCAGVGCFDGICWKAYVKQLSPLQAVSPTLGVLTPYKAFERDLPVYGSQASWIRHALNSFQVMPKKLGVPAVPASRLVAVVQGWDVTPLEISAQLSVAENSGASGAVVAYAEIKQSWEPRIVPWR